MPALRVRAADVCGTRGCTAPEVESRSRDDSGDDDGAATDDEDDAKAAWVDERIDAYSAGVALQKAFGELMETARWEAERAVGRPLSLARSERIRPRAGHGPAAATAVMELCDGFEYLVTRLTKADPSERLSAACAMEILPFLSREPTL